MYATRVIPSAAASEPRGLCARHTRPQRTNLDCCAGMVHLAITDSPAALAKLVPAGTPATMVGMNLLQAVRSLRQEPRNKTAAKVFNPSRVKARDGVVKRCDSND